MNDIKEIELSIEQSKKMMDMKEALEKLINNTNFKKVIDKGYFEEEAIRLVLLKSDHSMQKEEDQKLIIKAIDGIGQFRQYLHTVMQLGRMAEESIKEAEYAREEILNEEL